MVTKVVLNEADLKLIDLTERLDRAGVGRDVDVGDGTTARALSIGDGWIRVQRRTHDGAVTEFSLPRNVREVAIKAAILMGQVR